MKNSPPEFDSSNAESRKLWLAQVGAEYLQEQAEPAAAKLVKAVKASRKA